jgi:predicted O-linked N-acetylglucosamine transferase (SPINDLY family)
MKKITKEQTKRINETILLAFKYFQAGNFRKAEHLCKKLLKFQPNNFNAVHLLGAIDYELKHYDSAILHFKKALQINPTDADAYYNLGLAMHEPITLDEAILNYQKAIQLKPNFVDAHYYLGIALKNQGKLTEAVNSFDMALHYDPYYVKALWARCMSRLLIIYPDESSIHTSRKLYQDDLMKLYEIISRERPQDIEALSEVIDNQKPYYLPYQGFNDRELQQSYGDLVCKIISLRYPQFSTRPSMPHYSPKDPLRVGIVSGYFYNHSVWKIPIKGWIENIDRRRFILYGYYTGKEKDQETSIAKQYFERFIEDIDSFEDWCQIIRGDNLHILIFPEIGMDSTTLKLASLRLAPVQCTSWGHPETSGLPTIDYFLSSDLMEPPHANDHYTEKLIRLPNLSIYYAPLEVTDVQLSREAFGLRAKAILYLCNQFLPKYLPKYDEIFPRIAQQIRDCQFIFISNLNNTLTDQIRLRFNHAFQRYNLNVEGYIVFLPILGSEQYHAMNHLADIYLDSIGWSGCNSTFEAIACDLPIVTLPGELMRGRHSSAMLTTIGLTENIASNLDEYVSLAVKLGQDSEWRKYISNKISKSKHLAYCDRTCITALEEFFEHVVKEEKQ